MGTDDIRDLQRKTIIKDDAVVSIVPALPVGLFKNFSHEFRSNSIFKEELPVITGISSFEFGMEASKTEEQQSARHRSEDWAAPYCVPTAADGTIGIVDFDVGDDSNLKGRFCLAFMKLEIQKWKRPAELETLNPRKIQNL